uniref:Capsid protein VP1 n=1 Tax=Norovirus GII TaxID=122929 RepID=A0A2I6SQL3_NORV|nr:capsid protein VP1 [Norovirus GII]
MRMASSDAPVSGTDGAAGLVPESQQEVLPLEPVAGVQLAAPVAGQSNIIDPWIRMNFVQAPAGEFTVSPRNAPGEVLIDLELGPELNPYLNHLARMYNGYVGGMEVEVVLAGNAFTAGKILFAAVPPSFPTHGISAAQATMLPHVIVDVRQLEPVRLPLPDVRNVMFHFCQENKEPRMRIVAILYTPLRANGAGDDVFTVSCRVLTRPSPDFDFIFLVPPSVESKLKQFTLPNLQPNEMTNSRFPTGITQLYTSPNTNLVVQFQNGRCLLDGTLLGTTPVRAADICSFRGVTSTEVDATDSPRVAGSHRIMVQLKEPDGEEFSPTGPNPAPVGTPDFQAAIFGTLSQRNTGGTGQNSNRAHFAYFYTRNPTFAPGIGTVVFSFDTTDFQNRQPTKFSPSGVFDDDSSEPFNQFSLPYYNGSLGAVDAGKLAPPVAPNYPGEQILYFRGNIPFKGGYGEGEIDSLLPQEWITHFYAEQAPTQGDAALLRYYNPDTGRVLFECKLHREGFITINYTGSNALAVPVNGVFRFEGWVNKFYTLTPMGNGNGRRGRRREL